MTKEELKTMMDEIKKEDVEKQEAKKADDTTVEKIVEGLGTKIAEAIAANNKGNKKDGEEFAAKYFSKENGFAGIKYPEMDKLSSLSKEDKILVWFKALMNKDQDMQANQVFKALVEGTDDQGGYLVPEEFRAEVFRVLPNFTVMRKLARVLPMNTDTLNLNTLVARPYAYWTAEYASKTTTSAEFGRVVLHPNDLVCLLPVTHQLIADANIDVIQFITALFGEAIGMAEDKAFFTGSGTGQPKGISTETIGSVAAGGALAFDHLQGLLDLAPQRVRNSPTAAYVAHNHVISALRKLKDTTGRYIWEPSVQVGQPDRVYGRPIYEQNDLSSHELYFGDWNYYIIGDRQQIVVETTREGGNAWRQNATEIKAVERVDGKTVLTAAFKKVTGI